MRTGDTSAQDRQGLIRRPPDLLITTPESLYLMLTSSAAETLVGVETVIIDEIHALAPTKRGAHLALSLERLEEVTPRRRSASGCRPRSARSRRSPGSSAGVGARRAAAGDDRRRRHLQAARGRRRHPGRGHGRPRPASRSTPQAGPGRRRRSATRGRASGRASTRASSSRSSHHRSTIIFCNARRQAERLAAKLNELAEERGIGVDPETGRLRDELVKAHHGSLAREQRIIVEDELKRGDAAGHRRHEQPRARHRHGRRRPRHPGRVARRGQPRPAAHRPRRSPGRRAEQGHDLPEAPRRPARGRGRRPADDRRARSSPRATCATRSTCSPSRSSPTSRRRGETPVADARRARAPQRQLRRAVRRAARQHARPARRALSRARSSPSCGRGSCGTGSTTPCAPATAPSASPSRPAARSPTAACSACSSPTASAVGELDEEMVYESRPGETFLLGASTWRIEDITFERVTVTPAPGEPGKMPFWHGDRPGRPLELGRALGAFVRELRELPPDQAHGRAARATTRSTSSRRTTCCSTSTSRPRPPASCPTTARSSSSGSATRSATGGSACSARSARRSTRRGRWPSSGAWPSASTCRSSRCGATTASSCGCPRPPTSCRSRRC